MKVESITLQKHIEKYMTSLPESLVIQKSPIQVYSLEKTAKYLKYPTPLLIPQYNFIIHITQGQITAQVGTDKIQVGKGNVTFGMTDKVIARHKLSEDLTGFCTIIESSILEKLLTNHQFLRLFDIHPSVKLSEYTHSVIGSLNSLLLYESGKENKNNEFVNSILQAILLKLLEEADTNAPFTRREEIAFRFKQFVYKHYKEHNDLIFYAQKLNISENYLNRCVKQIFNKPPKTILNEIIIQQSRFLLQDNTKEIAEIAYELNFNDPSYFGRLFKKVAGITPTDYRKSIMQDLSE